MIKEVGLWIDRLKAVIVTITFDGNGIGSTQSNVEKCVRFSGIQSREGSIGNMRDIRLTDSWTHYFEDVTAYVMGADSIQIFGPGETKLLLEKSLRREELGGSIVHVQTVDKMTDRQIEARVWQHFFSLPS